MLEPYELFNVIVTEFYIFLLHLPENFPTAKFEIRGGETKLCWLCLICTPPFQQTVTYKKEISKFGMHFCIASNMDLQERAMWISDIHSLLL